METLNFNSSINILKTCIVDNIDECKDCNIRYFYSTGCPNSDNIIYNNEDYRKNHCDTIKSLYNKVIWEY
ncbi:hypothetical protein [Clostridium tetani]|uniref:hypothetical protein n=1 Tax=Clostridium tetani TaxID=1513 RepID=UPI0029540DF1|nr:hypothetical protein [Clostridium tetani]